MRHIAGLALFCAAVFAAASARAWVSPAPDLVVYCTPGLLPGVQAVADGYTALRDVRVHILQASSSGLLGLIRHRARDDIVVADTATLDALQAGHLLEPVPRATLGLDRFVLFAKAGGIAPADAASLARNHAVVLPDPTDAASFDGGAVLAASGIGAGSRIGMADTPDVIFTVQNSENQLGLVQRSAVAMRHDLAIVATVSAAPALIQTALVQNGQSGNAQDFLAYLASAAALPKLRADGLEQAP